MMIRMTSLVATVFTVAMLAACASGQASSDLAKRNETVEELGQAGELYAALDLAEATLADSERVLGPEHPETVTGLINLAAIYGGFGRYGEAEALNRRALARRAKRVLGPEHPDTLTSVNNLAFLYSATGRHADAESFTAARSLPASACLGRSTPIRSTA